jgi:glycosidase
LPSLIVAKRHPALYQINTRVLLNEQAAGLGRGATLDDLPNAMLDEIVARGFGWVWLLGVWQTGGAGRRVARADPKLRAAWAAELPDLHEEDIVGSPFAVQAWTVHRDFGGDGALARIRERLQRRGLRLMLDFVPNHLALDHAWVASHPEYFVHGSEQDIAREPQNYVRIDTARGPRILAHGRDPYFDGWQDTVQVNHRHRGLREAQVQALERIADRCDGVRCDMAMLLEPDVFAKTWGERGRPTDGSPPCDEPFWPTAIAAVRERHPGFLFLAEVYWDRERDLQRAGFDFTYDKHLYDLLRARNAERVREHLRADIEFQERSARFLENHDELRAAAAFDEPDHRAAAVITFLTPGLRFFHEGQLDGRKVRVSVQLGRRRAEPLVPSIRALYDRLLAILARSEVHEGRWRLLESRQAWDGNPTHRHILATSWDTSAKRLVVAVNYGPTQAQGYLPLDLPDLAGRRVTLVDLLGDARYERDGDSLSAPGLYLDVPPWCTHVFELVHQQ